MSILEKPLASILGEKMEAEDFSKGWLSAYIFVLT
jgi:hypothetical protein